MSSEASSKASSLGKVNFWQHGEKMGSNKVKCKFCEQTYSGGITRFKEHLAMKRGNIAPCTKVPEDVKKAAQEAISAVEASKGAKEAHRQALRDDVELQFRDREEEISLETTEHGISKSSSSVPEKFKGPMDKHLQAHSHGTPTLEELGKNKGKTKQSTFNVHWGKMKREDACEWIARYVFETGVPFTTVDHSSFAQMTHAVGLYGPNLKVPTSYELAEKFLPKEVTSKKEKLESFIEGCKLHGCTLMTDCWTDKRGRSIMNLVIHGYAGTMFYDSENTSSDVHDGKYIYDLVNATIEKLGEKTVVQVVTDNASNNMAAAKLLALRRPSIF